jgi:hypothetical protein
VYKRSWTVFQGDSQNLRSYGPAAPGAVEEYVFVNSLGDWVIYGLGLVGVFYGGAKVLPEMVVACTLAIYRSYRKIRVGMEQIERELPFRDEKPQGVPIPEGRVQSLLPVESERWA